MSASAVYLFWIFGIFIVMLFSIGLYCILATFNLIRALIGVEILIKAVTLLIIVAGFLSGHTALTQSLVITMIVIEAVVMTIAVGIVLGIHKQNKSLDVRKIRSLKG
ncbi:MAG: NADH-quinone oxidoreductase subunit K [Candidatus Omnitrophica bacterium]|jgi:NADH:ubiquinone oxidoreductase subunit K|nr:NADH-quinone oxidoreductase subunit K [Candidatus Omnitrophota bacterium]